MRKVERHGRGVLEAVPEAPKKTAKNVVRIYYLSEGGEILCTTSPPMTYQAAEKLRSELQPCEPSTYLKSRATFALHVECFGPSYTAREPFETTWKGARQVVMPSTIAE